MVSNTDPTPTLPPLRTTLLVVLGFALAAFAMYGASLGNEFVRWDDGMLIYENPAVRTISPWSLKRIFTTYDPELYIPLTFLSYQIDYAIGGSGPFLFHLNNLLLHTGNALLVAWLAMLLTGRRMAGLLTGALFLVHPLHTEAVQWASARKDVLSTFFFLAAFIAYLRWVRNRERRTRAVSILCFVLALMAKVMAITLPAALLLADWQQGRSLRDKKVWLEKWPYALFAVIFGIIGFFGKQRLVESTALSTKLLMACKSAVFYLWQMVWPVNYSLLYPYNGEITLASPDFQLSIGVLVLLGILLLLSLRWTRVVAAGLLFYGITVAPTFLNFAKGGDLDIYFASDRYAYVPSIGIFLLAALAVARWADHVRVGAMRWLPSAVCACILVGLGWKAHAQSAVWKDTKSLFGHMISIYPQTSYVAHNNLGNAYRLEGDLARAEEEYRKALEIRRNPKTMANLGAVYRRRGQIDEALVLYREAIAEHPESPDAHFGVAIVYDQLGNVVAAEEAYRRAIALDPSKPAPYVNYGALLSNAGRHEEAILQYRLALGIDPDHTDALFNMGNALSSLGRNDEAIASYAHANTVQPSVSALLNLGILLHTQGRTADAIAQFRAVLQLDARNPAALSALRQLSAL